MKKPCKITAPPKDTRKELYFEIKSDCVHDWHDGEKYGSWERKYDSSLKNISRNKDLLDKWNFEAHRVNDEVYDAQSLYAVVVTYDSGDTFGNSEGNLALAFVTENTDEAIQCKDALLEQEQYEYESKYSFREKTGKKPKWDESFRDHPKSTGRSPWNGYFERVTSVDIVFLPVMG
jgi:hypothetical protein